MDFNFLVNGDLHFQQMPGGQILPWDYKVTANTRLLTYLNENPKPDFMLIPGDLTNNGYAGRQGEPCDELGAYKSYVASIEKLGVPVKGECAGNHDYGTYCPYPVFNYIVQRHGAYIYWWKNKGVAFISVHIYPDGVWLPWLQSTLSLLGKSTPTVIFWHYNLVGPWSDWWTDEQKQAFYNVIKGYRIISLVTGHEHVSEITTWNGIQEIKGSGTTIALCHYNSTNNNISVTWI